MRRKARRGGARQIEVTIETMGARGDGEARLQDRPVFLPMTLPGERVRARVTGERAGALRGEVIELVEESAERVAPPCPHFGPCGGCALQHWRDEAYRSWKAGLLGRALAQRGFSADPVQPLQSVPPGERRRAVMAASKAGKTLRLGFRERRGHHVVPAGGCLLLTPLLRAALPALERLMAEVLSPGEQADLHLLESEAGIDLLIAAARGPRLADREQVALFAESADIARVSWRETGTETEPVAVRRLPKVTFGTTEIAPAPGAFLQPSLAGERLLIEQVRAGLPPSASRAADLFAGCGTFTFLLAEKAPVLAVEGNAEACGSLQRALNAGGLASRVTVEARDLERRPLLPEELEAIDVVVFDPPRAGARAQAGLLATSAVQTVIAVSCNPTTLARDAALLRDGGYRLVTATPIDQFPWSGHLEAVAVFRRD